MRDFNVSTDSAISILRKDPLRVQQFLQRGEPPQRTASPRRRQAQGNAFQLVLLTLAFSCYSTPILSLQ